MVSHKHKCIFIHVPKAAGTSVENIFLEDLNLNMRNRHSLILGISNNQDLGPPVVAHTTLQELEELNFINQNQSTNYFKFSVVRDPYNRVYSFYKYLGFNLLISFENFVIQILPRLIESKKFNYFYKSMWSYVQKDGKNMMDSIVKLESLSDDLPKLLQKVGISIEKVPYTNPSDGISTKKKLKLIYNLLIYNSVVIKFLTFSGHKKKKIYNRKMLDVVNKIYKDDFEQFNYIKK